MADSGKLHIMMFPWFAVGHMTPYLHLSNELAERGHRVSILLPNKAQLLLQPLNLHPELITFHPLSIPNVAGLPIGTETASDIPIHLTTHLVTAMDLTRPKIERLVIELRPDFVFYDTAHWVPEITTELEIKSVSYNVVCAASFALSVVPAQSEYYRPGRDPPTADELAVPPSGYPSKTVVMNTREAGNLRFVSFEFGSGTTFFERITASLKKADAIAFRTCKEIEGQFCDYLSSQYESPVLLTGPVLPESKADIAALEEKWASWLGSHEPGSVVYCSFGSQFVLDKSQFREILLGFESSGYPFFVALKPPNGCSTIEEAMPEGFLERVQGKGVVHGGWVQQPEILNHPSVGCFVSHCGFGSMWESLMGKPQIVLVPHLGDQIVNTRLMAGEMEVAVEVEKDKSGWVSKESLCKAVKEAMDEDSKVGALIRENHDEWRSVLGSPGFMSGYIDHFVLQLQRLLD